MIKIAWMYYDILELYGDRGNISILESILTHNKVPYVIDKISIKDDITIENHDIIFLGGGSDYAQNLMYKDLLSRKNQITNALNNNSFVLAICGGYQLFGKYYLMDDGSKAEGLGIYDFYTESGVNRCVGNVISKGKLNGQEITFVGFENHAGETKGVKNPLGKIISGNGNEYQGKFEGCFEENFIGTYLHGSLLPKNPEIGKYIVEYVLKMRHNQEKEIDIKYLKFSQKAKEVMIERGN